MTDAVKKTTKKAATTATKAKAPAKSGKKAAPSPGNGHASNVTEFRAPHEQIAELAHQYWIERGGHHGSHEEDWFRAEQQLRGKAS
jgi:hypothetical protein